MQFPLNYREASEPEIIKSAPWRLQTETQPELACKHSFIHIFSQTLGSIIQISTEQSARIMLITLGKPKQTSVIQTALTTFSSNTCVSVCLNIEALSDRKAQMELASTTLLIIHICSRNHPIMWTKGRNNKKIIIFYSNIWIHFHFVSFLFTKSKDTV